MIGGAMFGACVRASLALERTLGIRLVLTSTVMPDQHTCGGVMAQTLWNRVWSAQRGYQSGGGTVTNTRPGVQPRPLDKT